MPRQKTPQELNVAYVPLIFAPDMDPLWSVNPGVLVDVTDLLPSKRSTLRTYCASDTEDMATGNWASVTKGKGLFGQILRRVDGTARLIVGTEKRLLENTGSTFVDISKGGADYTLTSAEEWSFATFGNDLIAVSKLTQPQRSTTVGGVFADLPGTTGTPPKASLITVNKNFVMLGDTNDGVDDLNDRVWWSGAGNDESWTPSLSTQCGNMRLRDTPGPLRALVNMRDTIVAYKGDSIYILQYTGRSPYFWEARLVSDRVGCGAKNGVAVVNGIHYFLHRTGVHRFDGASVQNIGHQVNRYLFDKLGDAFNYQTAQAVYDEYENVILWYCHAATGASFTRERNYALGLNPETGRFGFLKNTHLFGTAQCMAVVRCSLMELAAWKNSLSTEVNNIVTIGEFGGAGILRKPRFGDNANNSGTFTTGDIGNDVEVFALTEIRPRGYDYANAAGAMSGRIYTKQNIGDAYPSAGSALSIAWDTTRMRWNVRASARWMRLELGAHNFKEMAGLTLTTAFGGLE